MKTRILLMLAMLTLGYWLGIVHSHETVQSAYAEGWQDSREANQQ